MTCHICHKNTAYHLCGFSDGILEQTYPRKISDKWSMNKVFQNHESSFCVCPNCIYARMSADKWYKCIDIHPREFSCVCSSYLSGKTFACKFHKKKVFSCVRDSVSLEIFIAFEVFATNIARIFHPVSHWPLLNKILLYFNSFFST